MLQLAVLKAFMLYRYLNWSWHQITEVWVRGCFQHRSYRLSLPFPPAAYNPISVDDVVLTMNCLCAKCLSTKHQVNKCVFLSDGVDFSFNLVSGAKICTLWKRWMKATSPSWVTFPSQASCACQKFKALWFISHRKYTHTFISYSLKPILVNANRCWQTTRCQYCYYFLYF